MLRLAIARGGLWFFGTIIVVWVFGGPDGLGVVKKADYSFWEQLAITLILGFIVGGCIMFKTWYDSLESERSLQRRRERAELAERKKALEESDDTR